MNPKPRPRFFVGIDSDGCAFDAMEIKHKECFTPNTILHWKLQPVSKYARQTADFVNLYSCWRGGNRWPSLVKVLELLAEHPEVRERGFRVPEPVALRQFVASGFPLSDVGLADYRRQYPDLELETAAAWSAGVNQSIATMVHGVPPFPGVRETLQLMKPTAELVLGDRLPKVGLVAAGAHVDEQLSDLLFHRHLREGGVDPGDGLVVEGKGLGFQVDHDFLQGGVVGKRASNSAIRAVS